MLPVGVAVQQRDASVTKANLRVAVLDVTTALTRVWVVGQRKSPLAELQEHEVGDRLERLGPLRLLTLSQRLGMETGSLVMVTADQNLSARTCAQPLERTLARVHGDVTQDIHEVILADHAVPVLSHSSIVSV